MTSPSGDDNELARAAALLAEVGAVSPDEAAHAVAEQHRDDHGAVGRLLARGADPNRIRHALAGVLGFDAVSAADVAAAQTGDVDDDLLDEAWQLGAVALITGGRQVVAAADPTDPRVAEWARRASPDAAVVAAPPRSVTARLASARTRSAARRLDHTGDAGDADAWIDALLDEAALRGASDVHLSVRERVTTRLRVDGVAVAVAGPRRHDVADVVRARAAARTHGLDGGSVSHDSPDGPVRLRVAAADLTDGQRFAFRLLEPDAPVSKLDAMGFSGRMVRLMRAAVTEPSGMVVVSGPTGAGKTTTAHGMLRTVDAASRAVLTVEHPVEYPLEGADRLASSGGDTGAALRSALRSALRQDADVLLIGEVRDQDTAQAALDAAATGHLVVTTVHAATAVGVFARFGQLGVDPSAVADNTVLVVNQRLVRRVHHCHGLEPAEDARGGAAPRAGGCDECLGTGYQGRAAVGEALVPSDQLRMLVARGAGADELRRAQAGCRRISRAEEIAELLRSHATTHEEVRAALGGLR